MYDIKNDSLFQEKYKRLDDALHFRPVDRLPYCDWVQNADVIRHYSYPGEDANSWSAAQVYLFAKNAMDLNQEHTPSYTPHQYIPTPQDLHGIFDYENAKSKMKLRYDHGDVWRVEDGDGYVWEYNFWTRWIISRPFADYEGMLRYLRSKIEELQYFRKTVDWSSYGAAYRQNMLDEIEQSNTPTLFLTPFGGVGFDLLYQMIGWEYLSQLIYSEEKVLLWQYVSACVALSLRWIDAVADRSYSPVALIYSDIAYKCGLMISPGMLEQLLSDGIGMLTEAYHAKGIKVIYHSEGNIQAFIPVLIRNKVDGINPLEPYSDMEILQTRKRYPGLVLYGGINDGEGMLMDASPQAVEAHVKKVIREIGKESGVLLGSSGEVSAACDTDNVIAMIETIRNTPVTR